MIIGILKEDINNKIYKEPFSHKMEKLIINFMNKV